MRYGMAEAENKANDRTLTEYFSPRSKVKEMTHQLSSLSSETPMKPSQMTNRLSHTPPRRILPLQSPELCQKEKLGSPNQLRHSHWSPANRTPSVVRDRSRPPQHSPQPSGTTYMSRIAPTTTGTSATQTQHRPPVFSASPPTRKDLSNHSTSSHPRSDQGTDSGGKGATALRHKSKKGHHHLLPQSAELSQDLNLSSHKRHRESGGFHNRVKKQCTQHPANSAQTPKPAAGNPVSTSPESRRSSASGSTPNSLDGSHTRSELQPPQFSGAKLAFMKSSQTDILRLTESQSADNVKDRTEANHKGAKLSAALSSDKHVSRGHHHHSGHCERDTLDAAAKTTSRAKQTEDARKSDSLRPKPSSKSTSGSQSDGTAERSKMHRKHRKSVACDNINELFMPDPFTYVTDKTVKHNTDVGQVKLATPERSTSSGSASTSGASVAGSLCHKATPGPAKTQSHCSSSKPAVPLKIGKIKYRIPHLSSPDASSSGQPKEDGEGSDPGDARQCASPTPAASSEQTPTPSRPQAAPLERQASGEGREQASEVDSLDDELDLSLALDLDVTQASHSSEEEQLLSLQEMMECVTKPAAATPEKAAFPSPGTPVHRRAAPKSLLPTSTAHTGTYKNNLDQMIKDINTKKKAKEIETELLNECEEDRLRVAEYEEAEESQEKGISTEQQEFLQRYSLVSSAIREVPPGEVVFNLEKQGRIFNQDSLQLQQCMVHPQGAAQKTLLSSSNWLRLHVNIGLFQEAFDCSSPCPAQVTQFLFKMMSVHTERIVSEKILQALCDIARTAAYQIVQNGNQQFQVWVPSLADVTLVLMNMGVAFVSLFPFENLQPPFTEGDLLENVHIKSEIPPSKSSENAFPKHNCNNVLKYLSYCMALCPKAYSNDELLLLLNVVGRMALDTQLVLQSSVDLHTLPYMIINNFRSWDAMLPRICLAFTDLTEDHHNMCLLVQLLPHNIRGNELKRHLSMSMISKLLDGSCRYRPTGTEFQLVVLRPYICRMQPSALLRNLLSSTRSRQEKNDDDMASLDQQSYYLCYSLLTLANEASNFQFFPAHQKRHLLDLCSELESHVKCNIRESEKCLYRSKVKDLVARIYTKWQMVSQRIKPLNSKLYDYWESSSGNTGSLENHTADYSGENKTMTLELSATDEEEEVPGLVEETGSAFITEETGIEEAEITEEAGNEEADMTEDSGSEGGSDAYGGN